MKTLAQRLSFNPRFLRAAAERVAQEHAGVLSVDAPAMQTDLADLKMKLLELGPAPSPESIESFSRALPRRQLPALALGLLTWQSLTSLVEKVLLTKRSQLAIPALWRNLKGAPDHAPSFRVLKALVNIKEPRWPKDPAEAALLKAWLDAPTLERGVLRWTHSTGSTLSASFQEGSRLLERNSRLAFRLANAILRLGESRQILAEEEQLLLEAFAQASPQEKIEAGGNYLNALPPGSWTDGFCDLIRGSFGMPKGEQVRHLFWSLVPLEVQDQFQAREIRRRLAQSFVDHERKDYWVGSWSSQMLEVHLDQAEGTDYAIMFFQGFAVVEFFETGNAAYFYDKDKARAIARNPHPTIQTLKHKMTLPVDRMAGEPDNRLSHTYGWRTKAHDRIERWLAYYGPGGVRTG